jgi:hypothetical protein
MDSGEQRKDDAVGALPKPPDMVGVIPPAAQRFAWVWAPAAFAVMTLAMFGDLLITTGRVASSPSTDLALQFIAWREFGFTELAHGNLALWNPYVYGGMPYFAGFQSALLYPLNWLHLIFPVGLAFNWVIAIQFFLAGYFTYFWARGREIGIGGAILAGMMFMCSGPYFLHVYAGHPPHLAVMIWTPLMLLTLDKLAATGNWRWLLLGIISTSLHILAGHPQYVYYTGIALSLYTALHLIKAPHRWTLIGGFVGMYVGAVLLTAIQLLPGIEAASESVRSGGTTYAFASTFSLPPAHFITLLAPNFFGSLPLDQTPDAGAAYWGAGYLWELSLFVSITGLTLACMALRGVKRWAVLLPVLMIGVTLSLALGRHLFIYRLLFDYLPGYSSFRGTVKFAYLAMLFVCLLAGMGFDLLLTRPRQSVYLLLSLLMAALLLLGLGAVIWSSAAAGEQGLWHEFVVYTRDTAAAAGELFVQMGSDDVAIAGKRAGVMVCGAAATLGIVTLLLWASRFHRLIPYALLILAGAELFIVDRATRATMDPSTALRIPPAWAEPLAKVPPHQRVLLAPFQFANIGMALGYENLQGYDPGILKRYAEVIYTSQNLGSREFDIGKASQYLVFVRGNVSLFRMLRCGLAFVDPNQPPIQIPDPLPQAVLVTDVFQPPTKLDLLRYLCSEGFNPARTAVTEAPVPGIVRSDTSPGSVTVANPSTDALEITADVAEPALLVVTDNYSQSWRVSPITAAQAAYPIIPANHTQIGIALSKGKHHFILEYSPLGFRLGRWISLAGLLGYLTATILLMRRGLKLR